MATLAEAAKQLGSNKVIMNSYVDYEMGKQTWFFSPNPNLDGATSKPRDFKPKKWNNLSVRQKMTIATLAGFGVEGKGININNKSHSLKLVEGYNKWQDNLYSVFWSDGGGKKWLCNVFVGDAIYLFNGTSFASGNKHYYSPNQIYYNHSPLKKRESYKDVEIGDIVLFGETHMEIITDIEHNWIADDGFCSIGAGRPNKSEMGIEKCDGFFSDNTREIDNRNHSYYYL